MEAKNNTQVVAQYLQRLADIATDEQSSSDAAGNERLNTLLEMVQKIDAFPVVDELQEPDSPLPESLAQASHHIDLALKTLQESPKPILSKVQQLRVTFVLSETCEELGSYAAALTNYRNALDLATHLQDESTQGQIQYRIARLHSQSGDWENATQLLAEAQEKLEVTGNLGEALLAQIERAQIAYRKGDYATAQRLFAEALPRTDGIRNIRSKAVVNNHLGIICRMQQNHDAAFWHFQQALIDFQTIQDHHGAAECMNNLGVVHLQRQEFERAKYYFDKALQLCQEIANFPLLAFVYANKAELYTRLGDLPMAFSTCVRALEHLIAVRNPIGIAKSTTLMARMFGLTGESTLAEALFKESIRLYEEFQVPLGLANCYKAYAALLAETDRLPESVQFEKRADEIFQRLEVEASASGEESSGLNVRLAQAGQEEQVRVEIDE